MELNTVTEFTPFASFAGGALLGLSAVMLMALLGRIAGISGITNGALGAVVPLSGAPGDRNWRIAFVLGLLAAPLLTLLVTGQAPQQTVSGNLPAMAVAGLLVGIGSAMGSGCTSGHGVCGLARLSPRSLVAVVSFMSTAALTVFLLRHIF